MALRHASQDPSMNPYVKQGMKYAALVAAGIIIAEALPSLNLELPFTGSTPAHGSAHTIPHTTTAEIDLKSCDEKVTSDVGSTATTHWKVLGAQIGGYYISKAFPTEEAECAQGGLQAAAQVTMLGNVATEVDIPAFSYSPFMTQIDEFSPLMCIPGIGANATAGEIKHAISTYNKDSDCDPEGHTTGAGSDAKGAGNADELARRDAVLAAALTPVPNNITNKFENDLVKALEAQARKQFPGAKVVISKPVTESPLQQVENGWNSIGSEVVKDYSDIRVSKNGSSLEIDLNSHDAYGTVYVDADLTEQQVDQVRNLVANTK